MRVVARVEQEVVGAELLDDLQQVDWVRREVQRLERETHVLADVRGRRAPHPGDEAPKIPPLLVEAPEERRQPGPAGFKANQPQAGELVEDALGDNATELGL